MKKGRKKSLVGWTNSNWKLFKLGHLIKHDDIDRYKYFSEATQSTRGKIIKVRITIEEL